MTESEARESPLGIPSDSLRIFLRRPSASPSYRMDWVCVCQECGDFSIHAWGGGQLDGQGLSPGPRRVRSGSPGTRCQGWMAREGKAGCEAEGAWTPPPASGRTRKVLGWKAGWHLRLQSRKESVWPKLGPVVRPTPRGPQAGVGLGPGEQRSEGQAPVRFLRKGCWGCGGEQGQASGRPRREQVCGSERPRGCTGASGRRASWGPTLRGSPRQHLQRKQSPSPSLRTCRRRTTGPSVVALLVWSSHLWEKATSDLSSELQPVTRSSCETSIFCDERG